MEPPVVVDQSHPIPIGETVTIIRVGRSTPQPQAFIEGRAVVKRRAHGRHRYRVQFIGDPTPRERLVHREYQSDPERMLSIIRDLWDADHAASPSFSEFFPDESA
jgi:hypothetical protein